MKTCFIALALAFTFASAHAANTNLARKNFENTEGLDSQKAIVELYKAEMANPASKLAAAMAEVRKTFDGVWVDPEASDVVLLESGQSAGEYCANSLLPIRYGYKSTTGTIAYLSVGFCTNEGEKGFVYIEKLVDVSISDHKKR